MSDTRSWLLASPVRWLGSVSELCSNLTTYVEPRIFDVMLGVHSLAYGLIGGLGTALGPLLGVLIDIGLLESIRVLAGYRMIIFGGLVALLLIVRPRGLLDERAMHTDRPPVATTTSAGEPARPRRPESWRTAMRKAAKVVVLAAAFGNPGSAHAQVRAKADVDCKPAAQSCSTTASSSLPIPAPASRCPG